MRLKTTLDDFYERQGYMYGGGWISRERGIRVGTVRLINEVLSVAWTIRRGFWPWEKDEVLWRNVEPSEVRKVEFNEKPA